MKSILTDELDHRDHWEILFDRNYLRWFHLMGKEVTVTIEKVVRDVELTMKGGIKQKKSVMHFIGKDKPLVLNVTNAGSIAACHGNRPSAWPGKQVVLYPTVTKLGKDTVGCIRIKPVLQSSGTPSKESTAPSTTAKK